MRWVYVDDESIRFTSTFYRRRILSAYLDLELCIFMTRLRPHSLAPSLAGSFFTRFLCSPLVVAFYGPFNLYFAR
jgi:hypothetical protein